HAHDPMRRKPERRPANRPPLRQQPGFRAICASFRTLPWKVQSRRGDTSRWMHPGVRFAPAPYLNETAARKFPSIAMELIEIHGIEWFLEQQLHEPFALA